MGKELMRLVIRTFPTSDSGFRQEVADRLGDAGESPQIAGQDCRIESGPPGYEEAARVMSRVQWLLRTRYPAALVRRRGALGTPAGEVDQQLWYVFREPWARQGWNSAHRSEERELEAVGT